MTFSAERKPDATGRGADTVEIRFTSGATTFAAQEYASHLGGFWSQLGHVLAQDPGHVEIRARQAYERYKDHAGGVSKFSGDALPSWEDQDEETRGHWLHAVSG